MRGTCHLRVRPQHSHQRELCERLGTEGAPACREPRACMHPPGTPSECHAVRVFPSRPVPTAEPSLPPSVRVPQRVSHPRMLREGRPLHTLIPWRESTCSEPRKVLTSPDGVLMDVVELWPQDPSGSLLGIPTGFSSPSSMGSKHEGLESVSSSTHHGLLPRLSCRGTGLLWRRGGSGACSTWDIH